MTDYRTDPVGELRTVAHRLRDRALAADSALIMLEHLGLLDGDQPADNGHRRDYSRYASTVGKPAVGLALADLLSALAYSWANTSTDHVHCPPEYCPHRAAISTVRALGLGDGP
ncbi:hypothetical protein ACIQCF_33235 [Streptomyces sp. NPDC088353]|uniref:hypothetical protein n=1 Tax=Streptomyces sp. NPDC088353 TaxID=3365855 RepID=UPI003822DF0F